MKRQIMLLLFLSASIVKAQFGLYYFDYSGQNPGCNPLDNDPYAFSPSWQISHGTPEVYDVSGQGFYSAVKLIGSYTTFSKSEGLFTSYNFQSSHSYTISISLAHINGNSVGARFYAANGLTPSTNSSCSTDIQPIVASSELIHDELYVYDGLPGSVGNITINNWVPSSNYSQFWMCSNQPSYTYSGNFYISKVQITDHGVVDNQPPSSPSGLSITQSTSSSLTASWGASFDNVGVAGYKIYRGATYVGSTTSTTYTLNGLISCNNYTIGVRAYDAAGNLSKLALVSGKTKSILPEAITLNTTYPNPGIHNVKATQSVTLMPGFDYKAWNTTYEFNASVQTSCSPFGKTDRTDEVVDTSAIIAGDQLDIVRTSDQFQLVEYELKTYPNPTEGVVTVELNLDSSAISGRVLEIYNTSGALVDKKEFYSHKISVDLSVFGNGIYFIKISDGDKVYTQKVVCQ